MRELQTMAQNGFMSISSRLAALERVHTSYLLLGILAGVSLAALVLFKIGLIGWVLRCFGALVRASIRGGFRVWEYLLGWANWEQFLAIACAL